MKLFKSDTRTKTVKVEWRRETKVGYYTVKTIAVDFTSGNTVEETGIVKETRDEIQVYREDPNPVLGYNLRLAAEECGEHIATFMKENVEVLRTVEERRVKVSLPFEVKYIDGENTGEFREIALAEPVYEEI